MPLSFPIQRLTLLPAYVHGKKEGYVCPYCDYEVVPSDGKAVCRGCMAEWHQQAHSGNWYGDKPPWLPTRLETLLLWNR